MASGLFVRMVLLAAGISLLATLPAAAQSPGRYTFGGQFLTLFTTKTEAGAGGSVTTCGCGNYGGGVRFTARLAGRLSLDADLDFLPKQGFETNQQNAGEIAVGPRLRVDSNRRLAVYIGLRPAWLWRTNRVPESPPTPVVGQSPPQPSPFYQSFTQTFFGFDLGATIEFNLSRRWLGRFNVSDLWLTDTQCPDCVSSYFVPGGALAPTHNAQLALGLAYRF